MDTLTKQQLELYNFRANLWKEFVAGYQVVFIASPEKFADYCAKFRERWVRGF